VDLGRERRVLVAVRTVARDDEELSGVVKPMPGEAMVKVCGVAVARPQGQSRAPPRSSEPQ
jgi:hypothetical protein